MYRSKQLAFLLALAIPASVCFGRVLAVPETYESISAAVMQSQNGDTILVAPGVYVENINLPGPTITLASWILPTGRREYIDSTIIDGNDQRCVLRVDGDLHQRSLVRGFTLRNGLNSYGGGINCRPNVQPVFEDLVITDCEAEQSGGGYYGAQNGEGARRVTFRRTEFIGNRARLGGGANCTYPVTFENCIFRGNSAEEGAAIHEETANCEYRYVAFLENIATSEVYAVKSFSRTLDHLTFAGNHGSDGRPYSGMFLELAQNDTVKVTNSIFWDGSAHAVGFNLSQRSAVELSYCDVRNGRAGVAIGDTLRLLWGAGNITDDPQFLDTSRSYYGLNLTSPCRDAGDPAAPLDADSSRSDIGAFVFQNLFGRLEGMVTDRVSNEPASGVSLRVFFGENEVYRFVTDSSGLWNTNLYLPNGGASLTLEAQARYYTPVRMEELELSVRDTLWLNIPLEHPGLRMNPERVLVTMSPGDSATSRFTLRNAHRDTLRWSGKLSDADNELGDPWMIQDSIPASAIVDDHRINGVVFAEGRFYVVGSNDVDSSMVYVLDRDGAFLDSFPQPVHSRYGMKDLAWGGGLIWGSGESTIYGMTTEGEVVRRWESPFPGPLDNFACDPKTGILWFSGVTTDIYGYDIATNTLCDTILGTRNLRKYGLAWDANDPDSCCLYILHRPSGNRNVFTKVNTATGDTATVYAYERVGSPLWAYALSSLDFTDQYSRYGSLTAVSIGVIGPEIGIDCLVLLNVRPEVGWIEVTPTSGVLNGESETWCDLTVRSILANGNTLDSSIYNAEFRISLEGVEGEMVLPIDIYVGVEPPDLAVAEEAALPSSIEITSLYPTPFNSSLTLGYRLDRAGLMKASLTDLLGREVYVLDEGFRTAGERRISVELPGLPSGVYYVTLKTSAVTRVAKVVCLK